MRWWLCAAGAREEYAPAAHVPPRASRLEGFFRRERGLPSAGPSTSPLAGTNLRSYFAFAAVAALTLGSCGFFPESSFELAPSSRLPRWMVLPPGLSRSQVTVTMDYYVSPIGRTAAFRLYDSHKQQRLKVSGSARGDHPLTLKNAPAGFAPGYPTYEVITINGLPDVVEHRAMEPVFYMTDDPTVLQELGVPANNRWRGP